MAAAVSYMNSGPGHDQFVAGEPVNLHHTRNLHLEPDWVVVGVRFEATGEYAVIASVGLAEATLTSRARQAVDLIGPIGGPERVEELRATIGAYLLGFGATYAEAFADLLRTWNPDATPKKIIEVSSDEG